jgi:uncharacterized short protein YbdD (DUF466 family)
MAQRFDIGERVFGSNEHNDRRKTARTVIGIQEFATFVSANRSQKVDKVATNARNSHDTCQKILPYDFRISRVTQHSVPLIRAQD